MQPFHTLICQYFIADVYSSQINVTDAIIRKLLNRNIIPINP